MHLDPSFSHPAAPACLLQVVLEDRSMGRQVFCYACITRWLEVSSAGFTRAPHFYQTPFAADCCR